MLLAVFTAGFWASTRHRTTILWSAVFSAPTSFYTFLFVPEYWKPVRLGNAIVAIEDMLFSFSTGGIVWFLAVQLVGSKYTVRPDIRRTVPRYLTLVVFGFILWVTRELRLGVMYEALIGMVFLGIVLIIRRPSLWRLPLGGCFGFAIFYALGLFVFLQFFPHFGGQWNHESLWNARFLGLPLEELAWAVAFGFVWPLAMAYVFDARPNNLAE